MLAAYWYLATTSLINHSPTSSNYKYYYMWTVCHTHTTHTHTDTHTHMHAHTRAHKHTHAHTHTHACMHTYSHTNTHGQLRYYLWICDCNTDTHLCWTTTPMCYGEEQTSSITIHLTNSTLSTYHISSIRCRTQIVAASFTYLSFIVTALELSPHILTRAHLQKKKVEEERSSEDT